VCISVSGPKYHRGLVLSGGVAANGNSLGPDLGVKTTHHAR